MHKNRLHFEMKNKKVVDPITGKLRYPAHNRRYTKALTMREYVIDTDLQGARCYSIMEALPPSSTSSLL
jgi:hypothetical protein